MIADGDNAARNAFRVALLTASPEETPLPVSSTQELDPGDILEVRDMAEAIARAEQMVAAPRSSRASSRSDRRRNAAPVDMFETLGRRLTDDTAGPATPAPLTVATSPTAMQLVRPHSVPAASSPMVLSLPLLPLLPLPLQAPSEVAQPPPGQQTGVLDAQQLLGKQQTEFDGQQRSVLPLLSQ